MALHNNNLYYSHYQYVLTPNARYKSKIVKINSSGTATVLYADTTASAIYAKGFMGEVSNTLLMDASVGATSNDKIYKLNSLSAGIPTLLLNASGNSLKPQSAPTFKQGSSIIYIDAYDPSNPTSGDRDLWQTDGTSAGTKLVIAPTATNITHTAGYSLGNVDQWCLQGVTCDNTLYSILNYTELWREDGLTSPTKITVSNYSVFGSLATCAGNIFMTAQNSTTYKPQIMKLNCTANTGLVVEEDNARKFVVYPNPAKEIININVETEVLDVLTLKISNILGEVVLTETTTSNSLTLETNNIKSGLYFITIENIGKTSTQKIIIE